MLGFFSENKNLPRFDTPAFCRLIAVNTHQEWLRLIKPRYAVQGSCSQSVAQMDLLMTTNVASVPITCKYCTQYSLLDWLAMVSASYGFSFDTNISIYLFLFLFQPPEAPSPWFCSLMLCLFSSGELWESQLSVRAHYEGCGIWAEGRVDGTAA